MYQGAIGHADASGPYAAAKGRALAHVRQTRPNLAAPRWPSSGTLHSGRSGANGPSGQPKTAINEALTSQSPEMSASRRDGSNPSRKGFGRHMEESNCFRTPQPVIRRSKHRHSRGRPHCPVDKFPLPVRNLTQFWRKIYESRPTLVSIRSAAFAAPPVARCHVVTAMTEPEGDEPDADIRARVQRLIGSPSYEQADRDQAFLLRPEMCGVRLQLGSPAWVIADQSTRARVRWIYAA
jgi:hypothetical protein